MKTWMCDSAAAVLGFVLAASGLAACIAQRSDFTAWTDRHASGRNRRMHFQIAVDPRHPP
jgi:hypothetical protein